MNRFLAFLSCMALLLVAGCHPEPFLTVSPADLSFGQDGGSQTVKVSANYPWTASVSGTGITVSPTSGEGEATVTVTVAGASSTSETSGTVLFLSEGLSANVSVKQDAKSAIVVGDVAKIPTEGGTFKVDIQYNTEYTVEIEQSARSWITFNGTKAMQSGKLEFTFAANEGEERTGKVTVTDKSGKVQPVTLTFVQEAEKKVLVVGDAATVPAEGGTVEVDVKYNVDYNVVIESSASEWIHYIKTKAVKEGKLVFQVDANDELDARQGLVTLKDKAGETKDVTITITQEARQVIEVTSITLDQDEISLEIGASITLTATVTPDNADDQTVIWTTSDAAIATVENGQVTAKAVGTATVTAKCGGKEATCSVTVTELSWKVKERAALEAFYRANNGDSWVNKDNWLTDMPLNTWKGVSARNGHVTGIILVDNNVYGVIPPEIADLTELEILTIANKVDYTTSGYGPLPNEISALKNLRSLDLTAYSLNGNLPASLFNMPSLENLYLANMLGLNPQPIPHSISNLKNLKELELYNINLNGTIPEELGYLYNLTDLYISQNPKLTGDIPATLGNLVNLEYLELGGNGLSTNIPVSLRKINNYWKLWPGLMNIKFTLDDLAAAEIPTPLSPPVATLSGKTLDIEQECSKNQYTIICRIDPQYNYSTAVDYITKLEQLYAYGKDKGLGIITYFNNAKSEIGDRPAADEEFKQALIEGGAEWESFIRYHYEDYPEGTAPFYIKMGHEGYPSSGVFSFVVFGPKKTAVYTSLIYKATMSKKIDDLVSYMQGVLDIPVQHYESKSFDDDGKVETLQKASIGNGIDIVVTGDAFSDRLIADGSFKNLATQAVEDLFSVEPLKSMRNRFNVYLVNAVSKHEEYFNGNSTVFYGAFGSGTAVGGDHSIVLEYAAKAIAPSKMDNALVLVLMNSRYESGTCHMFAPEDNTVYAGSASIAYVPYSAVFTERDRDKLAGRVIHELAGHGLGKLADEYYYISNGRISEGRAQVVKNKQSMGWYQNIDVTGNPSLVPWSRFIDDAAFASENLGAYEGGFTYVTGVWRPTYESVMFHSDIKEFNAPCRAQLYKRIMILSEGKNWEFDYDAFVNWDKAHRDKSQASMMKRGSTDSEPSNNIPPVVVEKTWRQVMKK